MNSQTNSAGRSGGPKDTIERVRATLGRRYAAEQRFQWYGRIAILLGLLFLAALFTDILSKGYSAFVQTDVGLDLHFDQEVIDPHGTGKKEAIASADYASLIRDALREMFPEVKSRGDKRNLYRIVSSGASFALREMVVKNPQLIGNTRRVWLPLDDEIDQLVKGRVTDIDHFSTDGIASPTGLSGEIKVLSTANDFAPFLAAVKERLSAMADRAREQLERLEDRRGDAERRVARLGEELQAAGSGGESEEALSRLESRSLEAAERLADLERQIAEARPRFQDLRSRADVPGGEQGVLAGMPSLLVSINWGVVAVSSVASSEITGEVILPLRSAQDAPAGDWEILELTTPQNERRLADKEVAWIWDLERDGRIETRINTTFFTAGDSRDPELAGIWGAVVGSFFSLTITLLLSFPIGVATAVYLEEFAPKNRWTDLIEVNINNLAAVPSIVFGLLGLAVFLNFFAMPRSAPLVGGLVLTLMTLPTIIIASRAALKSVPPSIREAALGVGASRLQTVTDHVVPLALPGMLTGTIIGMAQALGETAPLLMIGMVAFIVDIPGGFTDPATALPVQIFLWADSPERAFVEKTSGAILVLLGFLVLMNALAVMLRRKFERRW